MPIFEGVKVVRGDEVRPFSKGVCVVDGKVAREVQKLFLDSARFRNNEPPEGFTLNAGEIFYEGGRIAEVRLRGLLPRIKNEDWADLDPRKEKDWAEMGKRRNKKWARVPLIDDDDDWIWRWPFWITEPGPDIPWIDDLRLAFSPRNLGRSYVAALRIGGPVLLWWDVESARTPHTPADSDARHIRVTQPVKISGRKDQKRWFESAIRYADALARSADSMKTLLSRLEDGGEIDFIDEGRAFGKAFSPLLIQRVNDGSPGSIGSLSFSMKELAETEMRGRLLNAVAAMTRDYLLIKPGRPPGSKTKHPKPEAEKIEDRRKKTLELKRIILSAITVEYEKFLQESPPAEEEFNVDISVVCENIGKSESTIYNWLRRIECSFDDLKTEAIKSAKN
jgi:hypothetical protein